MKLSSITLDKNGAVTCDHNGNKLYLQLPHTPDSRHFINVEPLTDGDYIKALQDYLDNHFGKGDRTLARLCYAGGQAYPDYIITDDNTLVTENGDEFELHRLSDYYNVEIYQKLI